MGANAEGTYGCKEVRPHTFCIRVDETSEKEQVNTEILLLVYRLPSTLGLR